MWLRIGCGYFFSLLMFSTVGQILTLTKSYLYGVWACFEATCMPAFLESAQAMTEKIP